jgi:hypothetical protein
MSSESACCGTRATHRVAQHSTEPIMVLALFIDSTKQYSAVQYITAQYITVCGLRDLAD